MKTPRSIIFFAANLAATPLIYVFRILLPVALVVLLAAASLQGVSAAAQGPAVSADKCSIPKHLARIRPNPDGEPVGVMVGITLLDVIDLNDVAESFKVDFMLNLQWQDARLSASARGGSLEDCILGLNDIWNPHFKLVNRRGRILEQEQDVDIAADGTVRFGERIFGELSSPLTCMIFHSTSNDCRCSLRLLYMARKMSFFLPTIQKPAGWSRSPNQGGTS